MYASRMSVAAAGLLFMAAPAPALALDCYGKINRVLLLLRWICKPLRHLARRLHLHLQRQRRLGRDRARSVPRLVWPRRQGAGRRDERHALLQHQHVHVRQSPDLRIGFGTDLCRGNGMNVRTGSRGVLAAMVLVTLGSLVHTPAALADWHQGKITSIAFGYDGTVTFVISGWSRTNCACYTTWPNYMCLSRARPGFKEEYAWLLKARAMDEVVNIYIDEATCAIHALYELQ